MENQQLKNKLSKIYELVKRGSTEGEQSAAKRQLDKLIEKYNLHGIDLENLSKSEYKFKYKTELDQWLLAQLVVFLIGDEAWKTAIKDLRYGKEIELTLTYLDWVTVETSFQYFKRHMAEQWKAVCAKDVARKRSAKTKKARLEQLRTPFFSQYIIKSKLYKNEELKSVDVSTLSEKELQDRIMMKDVQGGSYNKQVNNGLYLEA